MIEPRVHVPFWRRRKVLGITGLVVAVLLIVFGGYELYKTSMANVKWGYLAYPHPGPSRKQPLFPDRQPDRDTLSQALKAIRNAKEVKNPDLRFPRYSEEIVIVMKDGQEFTVDMAASCKVDGRDSGTCRTVEDHVMIQDSKRKPEAYFAESHALYELLAKAERNQKSYEAAKYPQHVPVGGSFDIVGDGWLTDKVTVTLKQWNTVFWTGETVPDHGHISINVKCPPNAKPGQYSLDILGKDWAEIGGAVMFDNP